MVSRWVRTTHQSTIFVYRPITCIKLARSLLALTRAYFRQQSRDGYLLLVLAHYLWQRQLVSSALMHLWTHRFARQFTIPVFVQQAIWFARQFTILFCSADSWVCTTVQDFIVVQQAVVVDVRAHGNVRFHKHSFLISNIISAIRPTFSFQCIASSFIFNSFPSFPVTTQVDFIISQFHLNL